MRSVRDVLRLRSAGLSLREIARSLRLSKSVVGKYLDLASAAGLAWPLPDDLDDSTLERRLLGVSDRPSTPRRYAEPDCASIHQELKRKGVTLRLLWEEYREQHPEDGYQFTQFGDCYREFRRSLKRSMRQTHTAGEKAFFDYAGQTVPVFDAGRLRHAAVFIAVLGASSYTYAEATWSQRSHDWIASHERAWAFFGGVASLWVPDNLKAAVTSAHRYEPLVNRTYEELAEHYGAAVLPARPYRPKDKAKAETGVLLVSRWILATLRDEQFHSLDALNARIRELLAALNERPFRTLPGCRRSLFEQLDRPALLPLPPTRFVYGDWARARVGPDYHVLVDSHAYSVPHTLVRKVVDIRVSQSSVEIFHGHRRVASHVRSSQAGGHSTHREHMPASHRAHAEWTPKTLLIWAELAVGPSTLAVVTRLLEEKPHPQQGYRACLGLRALSKTYSVKRLEAACRRALAIDGVSLRSVESILKQGLDALPLPSEREDRDLPLVHENVRGAEYYRACDQEEVPTC